MGIGLQAEYCYQLNDLDVVVLSLTAFFTWCRLGSDFHRLHFVLKSIEGLGTTRFHISFELQ